MPARVILTAIAARDLSHVRDWLGQPADRFAPGNQQPVVGVYVVSYRRFDGGQQEFVFVERIHGPGQER